jgi:hypothetical protein
MESFKSVQFNNSGEVKKQAPLNSHTRKLYPELVSFLNMQIKQEKLLKLERENHSNLSLGSTWL